MPPNKFTNRQRALKRMERMPPVVIDAARSQLDVEGKGMVDAIKPRVPFEEGDLRDTVKFARAADTATKVAIVVTEGAGGQEEKARAQEFGRPDMAAQPHFYPTCRERRPGIRRRMMGAARKAIRKLLS